MELCLERNMLDDAVYWYTLSTVLASSEDYPNRDEIIPNVHTFGRLIPRLAAVEGYSDTVFYLLGDMSANQLPISKGLYEHLIDICKQDSSLSWMHAKRFLFDLVTCPISPDSDENLPPRYFGKPSNITMANAFETMLDGVAAKKPDPLYREVLKTIPHPVNGDSEHAAVEHPAIDIIRTWNKIQQLQQSIENSSSSQTESERQRQFRVVTDNNDPVKHIENVASLSGKESRAIGLAAVRAGRMDFVYEILRVLLGGQSDPDTFSPTTTKSVKNPSHEQFLRMLKSAESMWIRPVGFGIGLAALLMMERHSDALSIWKFVEKQSDDARRAAGIPEFGNENVKNAEKDVRIKAFALAVRCIVRDPLICPSVLLGTAKFAREIILEENERRINYPNAPVRVRCVMLNKQFVNQL
jgi:hypothetical protein